MAKPLKDIIKRALPTFLTALVWVAVVVDGVFLCRHKGNGKTDNDVARMQFRTSIPTNTVVYEDSYDYKTDVDNYDWDDYRFYRRELNQDQKLRAMLQEDGDVRGNKRTEEKESSPSLSRRIDDEDFVNYDDRNGLRNENQDNFRKELRQEKIVRAMLQADNSRRHSNNRAENLRNDYSALDSSVRANKRANNIIRRFLINHLKREAERGEGARRRQSKSHHNGRSLEY